MSAEAWKAWAAVTEPYGTGRKAGVGALLDQDLLSRLKRYKRQVAKRYRVVEPDIVERALPSGEQLFISPKLDGELWFLVKREGDVALVAYNGRVLHGISVLSGIAKKLEGVSQIVIAGELVGASGSERPRSHHVNTALSDTKLEGALSFHAFDLVEEDGADALSRNYEARHTRLLSLLGEDAGARCTVVHTQRGEPSVVAQRYRDWVLADRFEGVVARSDRGLTYKIKPTSTVDLVVLAFGERITGNVKQVRELQVGLVREDGSFQLVGSVGTGLSEDDRVKWHAKLSAIEAKSSFRLANREGTLCRFVRPEIVVEVRVSDFLSSDGWDVPIRRMSLGWDPSSGWRAIGETRTAVPLHPVLLRERTDKTVDVGSVGMTQITAYLDDVAEEVVKATRRASAEVVRRAVFTKDAKGAVAVRKVVVVRTHKEREGSHPPFVVFATDYSPGRKEPLQTTLRTASTFEGADAHVVAWLVENVKKGWNEVVEQRKGAPAADAAVDEKPKAKSEEAAPPSEAESAAEEKPKKKAARKRTTKGAGASEDEAK
ncbi:hypothetical protein [Sandaracinus amylolyticus]|uniref:ATP dependent DNA ligase n=1 Tax=Sandaracinus amylolyticus TaxID=927083 RepID=UPI001F187412|nr:hypothetical protein [Sandaracinus amylolyticus]UJR81791.1 Hypothetical protein I5071_38510 [Sandaracinus amylolyticus]